MEPQQFYELWNWFDSLANLDNTKGELLFNVTIKNTPKFAQYMDVLSKFPNFEYTSQNKALFVFIGLNQIVEWDFRIRSFINRFEKAKWLPLVKSYYNKREFPPQNYHHLFWDITRNNQLYKALNKEMEYDERLPYPYVDFSISPPLIAYKSKIDSDAVFCQCANKAIKIILPNNHNDLIYGICYKCNKIVPRRPYCNPMYGSVFIQRWGWYVRQKAIERGCLTGFTDEDENAVRDEFGYKHKGEQWENETHLFYIVKSIFPNYYVVQHYRPKELEGLELDVWVKEIRTGFEYQGIQHYKPVTHWGGESALSTQKERDKKKKELCAKNSIRLIEVKYTETITEDLIRTKLL